MGVKSPGSPSHNANVLSDIVPVPPDVTGEELACSGRLELGEEVGARSPRVFKGSEVHWVRACVVEPEA